ncbi:hypothetical protein MKX01_041392 [Papaver californicum]|nr:hypothetical protein MKX01_041392 [Papaver californicum]
MARWVCNHLKFLSSSHKFQKPIHLRSPSEFSSGRGKYYDLFGNGKPRDEDFRKAWGNETDEDTSLWTGSDEDEDEDVKSDAKKMQSRLKKEMRKAEKKAIEEADLIDGDDSAELDDGDIPTIAYPNEKSDAYLDKLFEFEETPKKLAVENTLKKLKKGPDGRYTNVWEVMSDTDILIGAFEHIVSGPEYSELRQGGPKKLDMEFFKDIQAKMRDPNFKWSTELKLKLKNKLVSRKKWQKTQSRRRKAQKR